MGWVEPSDTELLESTDAEDFGRFYDRHVDAVVAFIGSRVREPDVIFDLCAETFARALANRRRYDASRGPAIGWLMGIARNLIIEAWRRGRVDARCRTRLGMRPMTLDDEQLDAVVERGRADLGAALSALPADQREAVLRRVVLDEGYDAIAAEVGCSEQVVRQRVSRGLKAMRVRLEDEL